MGLRPSRTAARRAEARVCATRPGGGHRRMRRGPCAARPRQRAGRERRRRAGRFRHGTLRQDPRETAQGAGERPAGPLRAAGVGVRDREAARAVAVAAGGPAPSPRAATRLLGLAGSGRFLNACVPSCCCVEPERSAPSAVRGAAVSGDGCDGRCGLVRVVALGGSVQECVPLQLESS